MPARRGTPIAVVVTTVVVVVAAWMSWFAGGLTFADAAGDSYLLTNSAQAVTFTAFGAIVLAHHRGHRIGWLFVAYGACYTASVACLGLLSGLFALPRAWELAIEFFGITIWIPAPAICLPMILQLFPDGRPVSPRWRWLVAATLALLPLSVSLSLAGAPQLGIAESPLTRAAAAVLPVFAGGDAPVMVASLVALVVRTFRAEGVQRLQVMWLLWAAALFIVLNAQRLVTTDGPVLFLLTLPLIPAAATVAIVRHQLYDIRLIINRSVVYGLLTIAVIGAYLGIVAVLSALAQDRLSAGPLIATGLIALAFAPARSAVQSAVDRVMYGQRKDPAEAAARVGLRLGSRLEG